MKRFFLCLLSAWVAVCAFGLQNSLSNQNVARLGILTSGATPDYIFYWSAATNQPEYKGLAAAQMGANPMALFGNASLSGGYVVIPTEVSSSFPAYYFNANASDSSGFAYPEQGMLQATFQYPGTYLGNAMITELAGKADGGSGPFDTNDGVGIFTALPVADPAVRGSFAGNNGAAVVNTPDLLIYGAAINTDMRLRLWWSQSDTRQLIMQVNDDPPAVTTTALTATACVLFHQNILGKDDTILMAYKAKEQYIYPTSTPMMTGTLWQDFNTATVSTTDFATTDHTPWLTWSSTASVTRYTTNSDAFVAIPSLVNNQTSASTLGLKYDINATTAQRISVVLNNLDQPGSIGFYLRNIPDISSNTRIMIGMTNDGEVGQNYQLMLNLVDTAGTQTLSLQNAAFTDSSGITVSSGSDYWVCIYAERNATSRLRVYQTNGTQVGSEVTLTAANRNMTAWSFGSFDNNTAQSAGTYIRVSNLVIDANSRTSPTPVWPFTPWNL